MTTFSVESYNVDTRKHIRFEIGTRDEMIDKLNELVKSDIDNGINNNYYKVSEISEEDENCWNLQKQVFPESSSSDFIFGEWIQIDEAAKYLDVTFGRVYNLITANQLTSFRSPDKNTLVSVKDLVNRKIDAPKAGRPSSKKQRDGQ